jgi:rhodanese-related sulfurtransferase
MADDFDRPIVLFCSEGHSSSLAAHTLQRLGVANATDLCGCSEAWANTTTEGSA